MSACGSRNVEQLVQLHAQSPTWVGEAVGNAGLCVLCKVRPIARLKGKDAETQRLERARIDGALRVHEFELVTGSLHQGGSGLWANAHPIDIGRARQRAVRFHANVEPKHTAGTQQCAIELEKGLATREDNEGMARATKVALPTAQLFDSDDVLSKMSGRRKGPATWTVGANKVRVTELAEGTLAVLRIPAPKVAARESAEHHNATCVGSFALQTSEACLDVIHGSHRNADASVGCCVPQDPLPQVQRHHGGPRPASQSVARTKCAVDLTFHADFRDDAPWTSRPTRPWESVGFSPTMCLDEE